MKHRFAKECLPQGNSVEAAHQFLLKPTFNGMGISETMEMDIGRLHLLGNPSTALPFARDRCTGLNHLIERAIEGDLKNSLIESFAQASGNFEISEFKDQTGIGRPPKYRLVLRIPGKNPHAVGFQKPLVRQVAADRQEPAGIGILRRWKDQLFYKSIDRHRTAGTFYPSAAAFSYSTLIRR